MTHELLPAVRWAVALGGLVAGLLVGLALERLVLRRLERVLTRRSWRAGTLLASALRGQIMALLALGGLYAVALVVQFRPAVAGLVDGALDLGLIVILTIFAARFLAGLVGAYARGIEGLALFANITKLLVFLVGGLVALQSVGVSITPILTALGVGGLAVALALQDTLSNLFAGIHIIATKQVRPGDFVKLESGEQGLVTHITWRNTSVRHILNYVTIIPNSKLASTIVTNYQQPEPEMGFLVEAGVDYRSDLAVVERVTIEVAREVLREVPGGIPHFEPFIRFHTFADFRVNFTVILRVRQFVDHYLIRHEFIKRLHERYGKEGISIPVPVRTVHLAGVAEAGANGRA